MESLLVKELDAIAGYIKINYYMQLKMDNVSDHNTIIDNGILLIIHEYCKPLLLRPIVNARELSLHTSTRHRPECKDLTFTPEHISEIKKTMKSPIPNYKCVVVGAGTVGKTCMLISYTTNAFPGEYIPTVFDNYGANVLVHGKPIHFGLWDTFGGADYSSLRPLSYPQTDIFIICMDVHDRWAKNNLDETGMWTDLAVHTMAFCQELKAYCPKTPRVLVGTKIDLRNDDQCKDYCYTKEEMELFADLFECDGYMECSALTQEELKATFDYVIKMTMKHREQVLKLEGSKRKSCAIL